MNARAGRVALGLFALAVAVRLLFLFSFVDKAFPFSVFYYGDSRLYREFALSILRGEWFDHGIPFHPPGFAYVLAWIIGQVGERPLAVRAVLAVAASASVPLTYLLGRALWGSFAGLAGALLSTFSFGLLVLAVAPNAETIYVPLLLAQALLAIGIGEAWESGRLRKAGLLAALSGVVLGAGSLTRAEHLAFVLIVPLALALRRPRPGIRVFASTLAILIGSAAIVVAPWTLHNSRAISRFNAATPELARPLPTFVLVSNYGPLNFALANRPGADGSFEPDGVTGIAGGGALDLKDSRQLDLYLEGYRRGIAFLSGHPLDAGKLWWRKLELAAGALALGFGGSNLPSGLSGIRRPVDLFVPDRRWWAAVILALAAFGAYHARRAGGKAAVVWLIVAHKALVILAFFGYARLLGHVLPFVFLLIATGIAAVSSAQRLRRAAVLLGWIVAAALTLELVSACANPRSLAAAGFVDPATGKIVQDAEVRLAPAPNRP